MDDMPATEPYEPYQQAVPSHSDATSATNSIPPKLAQVLRRLHTPARVWLYLTQTEFDDGTWSEVIEKTDLLIQAMDRANIDDSFIQTYYEALRTRNRDFDEDMIAIEGASKDSNGDFCEILADKGGDFAIAMLMVLKTMENVADCDGSNEIDSSEETGGEEGKSKTEGTSGTKDNTAHDSGDATEVMGESTNSSKRGRKKRKVAKGLGGSRAV
ncbi:unnamed protein product [Alternaria burnsii]|nr:unnamed protein product [Alternaria burnsii]